MKPSSILNFFINSSCFVFAALFQATLFFGACDDDGGSTNASDSEVDDGVVKDLPCKYPQLC